MSYYRVPFGSETSFKIIFIKSEFRNCVKMDSIGCSVQKTHSKSNWRKGYSE